MMHDTTDVEGALPLQPSIRPRASEFLSNLDRPRRKVFQEHALWDEMLLYAPDRDAAFSLNATAKAIWELCDGQRSLADISRELSARFDSSEDQLLADVRRAVNQLHEIGLLEADASAR